MVPQRTIVSDQTDPARKRLFARLQLTLISVLLSLAAGEVCLRLLWHNPYRQERPDHLLKVALHHPNTDLIIDSSPLYGRGARTRLRTDSRSYILPSRRYEHPDVTIAFLGGSTTECLLNQEQDRVHVLVSDWLGRKGLKVDALNAARSGNTIHDSLNILVNHVVEDEPDVVVIMHVVNDIGLLAAGGGYSPRMGHPAGPEDMFKWALQMGSSRSYIAALLRQTLANAVAAKAMRQPPPAPGTAHEYQVAERLYRQRLTAIVRVSRAFGIEPALVTEPLGTAFTESTPAWADPRSQDVFNDIVREVGEREGVLVIDLVRYLQTHVDNWSAPMKVFYDGMHVTDFGAASYAEQIAEQLYSHVIQPGLRRRR